MRTLKWRHNDHDGVSSHQPHGCLLKRLFRRKSKKTPKLRVTDLCVGNSPGSVNSPHKGPVTRKMFRFDDVIMTSQRFTCKCYFTNTASMSVKQPWRIWENKSLVPIKHYIGSTTHIKTKYVYPLSTMLVIPYTTNQNKTKHTRGHCARDVLDILDSR